MRETIERTLTLAAERAGDLTTLVYARLFAEQPQMEVLFWRDTNGKIKGEMLMRVFEVILDFIGERQYADRLIQCEVVTHSQYDVPPEVFRTFFGIVAATVRDALGADWTADMESSWRQLLLDLDHFVTHPDQSAPA